MQCCNKYLDLSGTVEHAPKAHPVMCAPALTSRHPAYLTPTLPSVSWSSWGWVVLVVGQLWGPDRPESCGGHTGVSSRTRGWGQYGAKARKYTCLIYTPCGLCETKFVLYALSILSENTKFNIASQIIHIGFIFTPLNVRSISFFKCFQINNDEMKCIFNSL